MGDLWKFDGKNWIWISGSKQSEEEPKAKRKFASPSNVVGARCGSAMWIDANGVIWIFGGALSKTTNEFGVYTDGYLNDLWSFNGSLWNWVAGPFQLGATNENSFLQSKPYRPGGRSEMHTWLGSDDSLWIFGGWEQFGGLNQVWNYQNGEWTVVETELPSIGVYGERGVASNRNNPPECKGGAYWQDSKGNVYIFGGIIRWNGTSYYGTPENYGNNRWFSN